MKVDQSVLKILSASECDGRKLRLPPDTLDRKLYVAVNKVIEACGGQWDRSSKSHVFPAECEALIETVLMTGEVRTAQEDGWFPTPDALALFIAREYERFIPVNGLVLEPSAGEGALIRALHAVRPDLRFIAVEKDTVRVKKLFELHSFIPRIVIHESCFITGPFQAGLESNADAVFMNPPFASGQAVEHVQLALTQLRTGGLLVAIMPSSVKFRTDRRHSMFRELVDRHGGSMHDLPEASFKSSGTNVNTVLVTMRR